MTGWALDLGTTNSGIARWDPSAGQPVLVELPTVCRVPEGDDVLEAPRLVPSAVHMVERPRWQDRLGALPLVARSAFIGRQAWIGRQALERNRASVHAAFAPGFKLALAAEATRTLARVDHHSVTARGVAHAYLRELLAEVKRATGHRIRDLVVSAPVSAFETYRAELQRIFGAIGVLRVRFIDEPLAAALGYGLGLARESFVCVVDIGGGTMHVELVRLSPHGAKGGQAHVVAKQALPLGGNAVDSWVLRDVCARLRFPLDESARDDETRFWRRLMLAESCRVKESLFLEEKATFLLVPPGMLRLDDPRRPGTSLVEMTRAQLVEVLERQGFYAGLEASLDAVLESAHVTAGDVEEVLLVGGSTLLPNVFALLERRFDRRRLRGWQPFEAVAHGAACYAAGAVNAADFIVHDYAFVTHDAETGKEQHIVVVPNGTRFPTPPDHWKRQVVPTCAMGEPETIFKLVICEVARADGGARSFIWDAAGDLHKVGGKTGKDELIVPLNASSPTLGYLDPPHDPRDRRPRLEIAFGVNAERWLVATVHDLLTRKELMREEPVVQLL
jgi:molecular chaperone DnaK (HSP70)